MNAKQVKATVLWWFLYRFGYQAAVTEKDGADVYGVTRAKYTHEVEVKVSKADLATETKCIDICLGLDKQTKYLPKFLKHQRYLGKLGYETPTWWHLPNYFSFAVPEDLVQFALDHIKDTPYGLFKIMPENYCERIKKAERLHDGKLDDKEMMSILRKVSTEIQTLREKEALTAQ